MVSSRRLALRSPRANVALPTCKYIGEEERDSTHRLEAFNQFRGRLVILEMFNDEHDKVIIIQLAQIIGHFVLRQAFKLAIDEVLQRDRQNNGQNVLERTNLHR